MEQFRILQVGPQFLALLVWLCLANGEKLCKPAGVQRASSQNFLVSYTNIAHLKVKIISESSVYSWVHCGTSCLQTRFCVAYNYKENSKGNEVNCQLTATRDHQFEKGRKGDNGWSFYEGVGERKLSCKEENECKNGGKMVWDPVKAFKCECLDGYEGELCEKSGIALAKNGRRLDYPVLKHLRAESGPECVFMCVTEHKCCRSVNYRKKPHSGDEKNCQLLLGLASETRDPLIQDTNFDHYILLKPKKKLTKLDCSCADALRFLGNNVTDFGNATNSSTFTNFTVSFWVRDVKAFGTDHAPRSMLSYAYEGNDNALVFGVGKQNFSIFCSVQGLKTISTNVSLANLSYFQHFCATLQNSEEMLKVYVNGSLKYTSKVDDLPGHFPGGGVWIIGHEQDKVGGGFDVPQAFGGELTEVNIWDRVLSPAEINNLASSCASNNMQGNYLAYSDFHIQGNVERFKPPCCK